MRPDSERDSRLYSRRDCRGEFRRGLRGDMRYNLARGSQGDLQGDSGFGEPCCRHDPKLPRYAEVAPPAFTSADSDA